MMSFNRKRLKISIVLFALVIMLLIFVEMDVFTISRYENTVSSQSSISTAIYILDDTYETINVRLPDVIPSNQQYVYTFSVSNFTEDAHSDTNLKYRIHIRTTTNIEIDYKLYDTLDYQEAESVCSISNSVSRDYHGTKFRNIYTDYYTMLYSDDVTDYFSLVFTFPVDSNDASYSGIAELIEINIESSQILQGDT